jgi:hypothetical protein
MSKAVAFPNCFAFVKKRIPFIAQQAACRVIYVQRTLARPDISA